jgi:hypothetical protein
VQHGLGAHDDVGAVAAPEHPLIGRSRDRIDRASCRSLEFLTDPRDAWLHVGDRARAARLAHRRALGATPTARERRVVALTHRRLAALAHEQ